MPLLRSLAEWEIHFAIDISRLTALAMRRLAGLAFSTELDDVKDDFTERSESRFQRWRFRIPRILGRRPRFATANPSCGGLAVNAAPLALNMYLTLALLMLMRSSSPSSLKKFEIRIPKSEIKLKRHI